MLNGQVLATPASVSKRKQACRSCRHRKKRCDVWIILHHIIATNIIQSVRPSCSLCRKWGLQCEYSIPVSDRSETESSLVQLPGMMQGGQTGFPLVFGPPPATSDFLQFPDMGADFAANMMPNWDPQHRAYPSPTSADLDDTSREGTANKGRITELMTDLNMAAALPSKDILLELISIFFDHLYNNFPCFHRYTLMASVQRETLQDEVPSFLYAICTVASAYHHDPNVRNRQREWYELAKIEYDVSPRYPRSALRTLQTAILICFHGQTVGDFSASWLCIAKAWRQACALRLNCMDASQGLGNRMGEYIPRTPVEKEEFRRTLWMLYTFDRNHSWPTGWPTAIDDRQFKVDIPIADELFQAMTAEVSISTAFHQNHDEAQLIFQTMYGTVQPTPFTSNLDRLISSTSPSSPLNVFHYICIAYVLLGNVSDQIHSLHSSPDTPEYAEECDALDSRIVKFRLSLPRQVTSILHSPPESRCDVIWLNVILNAMAILLHYRCASLTSKSDSQDQFARAVIAARNTASIIREGSRISVDILLNPHVLAALSLTACVLVIHWRLEGDQCLKADIDILKLVFQRLEEKFTLLGLKFRLALERDLEREEGEILEMRDIGLRGFLGDCSKWNSVKEKLEELGWVVT